MYHILEQVRKFLVNFILLKYVKSQRSYDFLFTKELIFGFQILDLKDTSQPNMKQSPMSNFFCFYQLGWCSVTYRANEHSIYHFCVMIKDFSISFSRVIIIQDFETVIFYVLLDTNRPLLFSVE